jgi:hypothetical protein
MSAKISTVLFTCRAGDKLIISLLVTLILYSLPLLVINDHVLESISTDVTRNDGFVHLMHR